MVIMGNWWWYQLSTFINHEWTTTAICWSPETALVAVSDTCLGDLKRLVGSQGCLAVVLMVLCTMCTPVHFMRELQGIRSHELCTQTCSMPFYATSFKWRALRAWSQWFWALPAVMSWTASYFELVQLSEPSVEFGVPFICPWASGCRSDCSMLRWVSAACLRWMVAAETQRHDSCPLRGLRISESGVASWVKGR